MHTKTIMNLARISGLLLLAACASSPADSGVDAGILQGQVNDLSRQLQALQNAPAAQQPELMADYWQMLKKQLEYARNLPGVEIRNCTDWTLLDPMVMGAQPAHAIVPCPVVHDSGPVLGWELPAGLQPHLFTLMMQQELGTLDAQVQAIAAETDAAKRSDLYRRLYETRYQDIQTVLGRGWMWTPIDPSAYPDSGSLGAGLLRDYCSQCHLAPLPTLHTQAEWLGITHKMHDIIQTQSRTEIQGVRLPSRDEYDLIINYLQFHAHNAP